MNILSLEAAAKVAGCAYMEDGRLLSASSVNCGLTHSETLLPMIDRVLTSAGRSMNDVEVIALTNGPGSFTGLRIAAACAKGLSMGRGDIPVFPVCTLDSLAYNVNGYGGIAVTVMDARRNQVYGAAYRGGERILEPEAVSVDDFIGKLKKTAEQGERITLLGDASLMYEKRFADAFGCACAADACKRELSAASTAALCDIRMKNGERPVPADGLEVNYLRLSQAEREGNPHVWDLIHGQRSGS